MPQNIIVHGGAGKRPGSKKRIEEMRASIREALELSYPVLEECGAVEAVVYAVTLLENNPIFNAGTGSKLQADGKARMTAALMDGSTQKFSAVVNIENVRNPIKVAKVLQGKRYRILAGREATKFARERGFRYYSTVTDERRKAWRLASQDMGTVGAVAIDKDGNIAAATSTGGMGQETPGRVSDAASPCGTYASKHVGVACTGRGEDIVNVALATGVGTRVNDGVNLKNAVARCMRELAKIEGLAGVIAIDRHGNIVGTHNTEFMSYGICRSGKIFMKSW
jgi:L-asparaginase